MPNLTAKGKKESSLKLWVNKMTVIRTIHSKLNYPIELIKLKPEHPEKSILIIGVLHGDEPDGEYLIRKYLESDPEVNKNRLLFIPCLNPDGKHLNTRQNVNGVDLNRNFPSQNWELTEDKDYFGGEHPSSERETKFVLKVFEQFDIDCILAIHAPYKIVNYDGPAKELAEKISKITGYPVQDYIGYPTPGSLGTFAGIERNIPTITLELPENEAKEELWEHNKNIFEYLANKF